jgi:hypothetical protein
MICDGRLINSFTPNTNHKSVIKGFSIHTYRELPDYDGGTIIEQVNTAEEYLNADERAIGEPFYRIFAVYNKDYNKTDKALGDFYDHKEAMNFVYELSGNEVHIYSL